MWTNQMLKGNAKQYFLKNYWPCIGVTIVLDFLGSGVAGRAAGVDFSFEYETARPQYKNLGIPQGREEHFLAALLLSGLVIALVLLIGILFVMFVGNVITVGGNRFYIENRRREAPAGLLFFGFNSGHYKNIVKTMFLAELSVFLWSFLLIVPGVIKAYEYMMVPFILAENPGMDPKDVLALSSRMMSGEKWKAFVLGLSFLGWYLLSALTCGILGIFYVSPYVNTTYTELYVYNKSKAYQEGYIHSCEEQKSGESKIWR